MSTLTINEIKINYRDNSTDNGVIKEIFFEDPYQIKNIPYNSTVVDVGAHIGTFSIRCANEKNSLVYAYEPCKGNYELLVDNIQINKLDNKIKAFNNAVSNKCENREFHIDPWHYAGCSFYLKDSAEKKTFDRPYYATTVECTTLKQIFNSNNITHCHLLKLDCEGEEKYILLDKDSGPLLKCIDMIIVEFHQLNEGIEIAEYLKNNGFSVSCDNNFKFERGTCICRKHELKGE